MGNRWPDSQIGGGPVRPADGGQYKATMTIRTLSGDQFVWFWAFDLGPLAAGSQ
jgi:hypothetical protein